MNINVRSILYQTVEFESTILEHEPDINVSTETRFHKDILNSEVTPPSYKIIRKHREVRGGGVAIIVKKCIFYP